MSIIQRAMSSIINVNGTPSGQTPFECRFAKRVFNEETPLTKHDIMRNLLNVKECLDNIGLTESLNITAMAKILWFLHLNKGFGHFQHCI